MIQKFPPTWHLLVITIALLFLPAAARMSFAASAWQDDWDRVLRAAKSEGKLSLIGPLGADRRDALTQGFQNKYGITGRVPRGCRSRNFSQAQRRAQGRPVSLGSA